MSDQATYLFSTRTSKALAEKIAAHYGQELGKLISNNSAMVNSSQF
jgi:ribose-phosphate pyrophosphokinase